MIIELRKKSQITLPKEIVKNLNLQEGDKFEVSIENGSIKLEPVAIYPKEYMLKLAEEIQVLREDVKFEYNTFNNVSPYNLALYEIIAYNTQFIKPKRYADNFPLPVHTTQATPVIALIMPIMVSPQ